MTAAMTTTRARREGATRVNGIGLGMSSAARGPQPGKLR